ncbi:SDR family NAD(P)-dependent oxidoreductase [Sphingomonas soli]|uniref:SDR family NAD(P)-dependent oxidoreductase n=1 Tax=Sphingomonas soli TaxID=266127 RepID=UPI0008331E2E|nr:SDR family NAD(P)-dependent oxidoreductase [Sphingomonas soli]
MQPFEGQIAAVTGAGSGIGAATARKLSRLGARVVLLDIDGESANRVAADCDRAIVRKLDITDAAAVSAAFREIADEAGGLHMLVNNAGGGAGAKLLDLNEAHWRRLVALNLDGAFHCLSAAAPLIAAQEKGGAIVNVASLAARHVSPLGGAGYSAAKAGVVALSRQAAFELAGSRVRVNTVLPGPVRTALTEGSVRLDIQFPLGRWVEAEDVAEAICFLLGPGAAMCTGAELVVDGGVSLRL